MDWKEKLKPSMSKVIVTIILVALFFVLINTNFVKDIFGIRFYLPGDITDKTMVHERSFFTRYAPGVYFGNDGNCFNFNCYFYNYVAVSYTSLIFIVVLFAFYLLSDVVSKKLSKFRKKSD